MKMKDVLETVLSGKDFKKGQKVTTPMGDGVEKWHGMIN